MIYEYLVEHYKELEPIFFSDLPLESKAKPELSKELRLLVFAGKLCRYDKGIYYLPKQSNLKTSIAPSADVIARYKYIERLGKVNGYYSGNTLANKFGITTQVPQMQEIVSNQVAAKFKEIEIANKSFVLRRPITEITNENYLVLQLLELVKSVDSYMDCSFQEAGEKVEEYIRKNKIKKVDVDQYIRLFPSTIFRNYYEMGLERVFT